MQLSWPFAIRGILQGARAGFSCSESSLAAVVCLHRRVIRWDGGLFCRKASTKLAIARHEMAFRAQSVGTATDLHAA